MKPPDDMPEDTAKDQQKSEGNGENRAPSGETLPSRLTWEELLDPPAAAPAREGFAPARTESSVALLQWSKALTPVFVLLLYIAYRLIGGMGVDWPAGLPPAVRQAETLSGIAPAQDEPLRLSGEVRTFVSRLEALRTRGDWKAMREVIGNEERAAVREHPVVKAFDALARTHIGERSVEVERMLITAEATLRPARREYGELLQELRVARAEQILRRSSSPEILAHNTDLLHELLGTEAQSPYEVRVRILLARLCEDIGDRMMESSEGFFTSDTIQVRQARVYYQMALRWIVPQREWLSLRPISPAAQPEIERITGKIRRANRTIHGPSLPLTGSDSTTWSGRRGTPVHDMPPRGSAS